MATSWDRNNLIREAAGHCQAGHKFMKTSFFKRKPDYKGAIKEYKGAASLYSYADQHGEAKKYYLKVGDLQETIKLPLDAAESYESAALECKETKKIEETLELFEKAALMYQEHGVLDKAALCFSKMADISELEKSVDLYNKAAQMDERPQQSAEYIRKAGRMLVKSSKFEEAISTLQQEIKYWLQAENYANTKEVAMGMILLHLTQKDPVAADQFLKSCQSYPEFGGSEEAGVLVELLNAYNDGDEEQGQTTLANPLFKNLEDFAGLVEGMEFPGSKSTSTSN